MRATKHGLSRSLPDPAIVIVLLLVFQFSVIYLVNAYNIGEERLRKVAQKYVKKSWHVTIQFTNC